MLGVMRENQGVGLAAPQVGERLRLFVATDTGEPEDAVICVNPRVEPFGPVVEMEEGCLFVRGCCQWVLSIMMLKGKSTRVGIHHPRKARRNCRNAFPSHSSLLIRQILRFP